MCSKPLMQWEGEAFETAAYAGGCVVVADAVPRRMVGHGAGTGAGNAAGPDHRENRRGARHGPGPEGDRPLSGLRVLDLSRVIAGPVAGCTFAAHGAPTSC